MTLHDLLRAASTQASEQVVTVLFADLRGFTGFAERHDPPSVLDLVNRCVGAMIEAVRAEHGAIDKFLGDGVMAVFGPGGDSVEHAHQAVRAARRMQRAIAVMAPTLRDQGWEALGLGIGMQTGRVIAGAVGIPDRQELTVLGDVVNVASRLTAGAAAGEVVLGGGTRDALGDAYLLEPLGSISIRGRRQPVLAWRLRTAEGD